MADPHPEEHTPNGTNMNKHALACSLLASLSCISSGYDLGVLQEVATEAQVDLKFNLARTIALVSVVVLCFVIGSIAAARTADWIGRRYTLLLGGAVFFAGSVLMGFATNYAFFMVGRFCSAVGIGYTVVVATVYAAEISPVSTRGFLTSLPEVFLNVGSLLGGVSTYGFSKLSTHLGWRFMVGLTAVPAIFLCLGLFTVSESPRWLVMKGRPEDAKRILDKTSVSTEESQLRLEEIRTAAGIPEAEGSAVTVSGAVKELLIHPTPSLRHTLVTALGVHFFQQASGAGVVSAYSAIIFQKSGVQGESHQQLITIAVAATVTICNLAAMALVDKLGRRILLLYSVGGMVFSLIGLAIGLTIIHHHSDRKLTWALAMCIICSLSCVAFSSIGIGPIAWIYSSEVFPSRLRALGNGMATALNLFTTMVVLISFPILLEYTGINMGGQFFGYAGIALLGWAFIYLFVPETKGTRLEEMETLFLGLRPFCSDRIGNLIRGCRQNCNFPTCLHGFFFFFGLWGPLDPIPKFLSVYLG